MVIRHRGNMVAAIATHKHLHTYDCYHIINQHLASFFLSFFLSFFFLSRSCIYLKQHTLTSTHTPTHCVTKHNGQVVSSWLHPSFEDLYSNPSLNYKTQWERNISNYGRDWDIGIVSWVVRSYQFRFILCVDDDAMPCTQNLIYTLNLMPQPPQVNTNITLILYYISLLLCDVCSNIMYFPIW
jgi:hypothetical protein